jgi:sugar lactone lactonase YvrE
MDFPPTTKGEGQMKRAILVLAVLALMFGGTERARAGMVLTSTATTEGYTLSTFASGFPNTKGIGPLGIAFPSTGGILVADGANGQIYQFATDTDGQTATKHVSVNGTPSGLAVDGSTVYITRQSNGTVDTIDPITGVITNTIISGGLHLPRDVVVNPTNHFLFVSTDSTNPGLVEVNPVKKTFTTFENINADGLTISADGSTLYAADTGNGHILGFNTTTGVQVFDSGSIAGGVDGTALGFGKLAGNIFVNTNGGTLVEVNLASDVQTIIGTGGSRGDFVKADPNGTLLLTQTDSVLRLTAPPGGGFGSPVPEPASITLLGLGAVCSLGYGWRRRRSA